MDANLAERLESIWDNLARAVHDRHSPFRTLMLCTRAEDAPTARIVVLRGVDRRPGSLWCHSDRRAAKVAQLSAHPACTVLLWDPRQSLQLRLSCRATQATAGPTVEARWAATPTGARRLYAQTEAPGDPCPPPSLARVQALSAPPGPAQDFDHSAARQNFCVIDLHVNGFDALWLHRSGHVRVRYQQRPDSTWHAQALVP